MQKMRDQLWREDALCRQFDPDMMFPPGKNTLQIAMCKEVCNVCPVKRQCLDAALTNPGERGIWGGTTDEERGEIHERRREAKRQVRMAREQARLRTIDLRDRQPIAA